MTDAPEVAEARSIALEGGSPIHPSEFATLVQAHLDGRSGPREQAILESNEPYWVTVLLHRYDDVSEQIERLRRQLRGPERTVVLADFESEIARIDEVLTSRLGPPIVSGESSDSAAPDRPVGLARLQLSWTPGEIVAWSAGPDAPGEPLEAVMARLEQTYAVGEIWQDHRPVKLPTGGRAPALSAPLLSSLGWLAGLGSTKGDDRVGASVSWMGMLAALAVQLVAEGRMVPQLKKTRRGARQGDDGVEWARFETKWIPAVVDQDEITALAAALPGVVQALENRQDPRAFTERVLSDLVDAICCDAADRLEVPAPPPVPTTKAEVGEAFLSRLDGSQFELPLRLGTDLSRNLGQWARPVISLAKFRLVLQLDAPDDNNAWYLSVLAPNSEGLLGPVESALVSASTGRRQAVKDGLARLERLFPELLRPGARRRGEVMLSQDEAWRLMTETGPVLEACGYDVRVPELSRKKPTPALRLTSVDAQESVVGAHQLANVSWTALFDDVELTVEDISRLASQARPLVRSHGKWIELDHSDLAEAAAALAERAAKTQLSGADMLRHALGLEGTQLQGGISLAGDGWAADLLRSASNLPTDLPTQPEGFNGTLRSYQAESLAWLRFLDAAGLGGCLALDMGLGKTPTLLAHFLAGRGDGPSLVVAPPAVVGNWASEARRFVPGLIVRVHHGPNRASAAAIPGIARGADIVITTYGTAVRDVDALATVEWNKVVLDEAQAIKNPTSITARELRRIPARTKVCLTGTPIENGLGDLWAIMDFTNPGLVGARAPFISQLSQAPSDQDVADSALRALNGILVFRRTKSEPDIAAELPDRIDELAHCAMTAEQIGLYQAVLDKLVVDMARTGQDRPKGAVLAAITALKQICNHPAAYQRDDKGLVGRSGKLTQLTEIMGNVFSVGERMLVFTHFASWGEQLSTYLSAHFGRPIPCYHGGLTRGVRDRMVQDFQNGEGPGALVLSLKAGGVGLNLTAASHVVLYDRWWNPAVEDQARDRVWRIGQTKTVVCHRLVCPGTVDERVEEVVAGKRQIADLVLPKSSSIDDLDSQQLQAALGIDLDALLSDEGDDNELTAAEPILEGVGIR